MTIQDKVKSVKSFAGCYRLYIQSISFKENLFFLCSCALEDAAIYQASASNSKGIVSCSGVLEVGEMNEFKIHQRHFAKIKQKADNKHKEQEGKENQEPLRTISPDRTQRKRRSTAEAFLSTPSSTEDEGHEESRQVVAVESDTALPQMSPDVAEEKPESLATVMNGQSSGDSANKTGTYVYDSAQKVFTAHQPKTPSLKKKLRISNSAKAAKPESPGERTSEERRVKEEAQLVPCAGNSVEVMEVENAVISSPAVVQESKNATEQQRLATADDNVPVEKTNRLEQQLTVPRSPAVPPSKTEGKQVVTHEREAGRKTTGERVQVHKKTVHTSKTRPQTSTSMASHSKTKDGVSKAKDVTLMGSEEKSRTSTGAIFGQRVLAKSPREGKTAVPQPQPRRGQSGDQLSEKEAESSPKNVSQSLPARLNEVSDLCRMSSWVLCAANTGLSSSATQATRSYF